MGKKLKRFFVISDKENFSYYGTPEGGKLKKEIPIDQFQ